MIYDYFDEDIKRLRYENLLKLKAKAIDVDNLEKHIAFGNYEYLFEVQRPYIVASFFKCVIKYMAEPLCTFALYPKFKFIA